jgi:hypothetical protein
VTCDLNKDGKFNVGDYTKLRRIILGIEMYWYNYFVSINVDVD